MKYDGVFLSTHHDVYEPSDDTFLLADVVRDTVQPGQRFVEVGCGAGLVSLVAARQGAHVLAIDRNGDAVALTRANARENRLQLEVVVGDLLSCVEAHVDVLAFNPPYLPTAEDEHVEGPLDWAFDGGPDGNVVVLRFAEQLAGLRDRPRVVLVIHSSLSDPVPLDAAMAGLGYASSIAAQQRLPYEELTVRRYD